MKVALQRGVVTATTNTLGVGFLPTYLLFHMRLSLIELQFFWSSTQTEGLILLNLDISDCRRMFSVTQRLECIVAKPWASY